MEQTQYNLLFRWFIGLSMDDAVWVPTVFTKNCARLIQHDAVITFFNEVLAIAHKRNLLSGEHFSVDGTMIQAWAGHKSFVRKDGGDGDDSDIGGTGGFQGEKRSNETHQSKTDPDAKLYRKGKTASELRYMGHTLSDNRHGLVVSAVAAGAHPCRSRRRGLCRGELAGTARARGNSGCCGGACQPRCRGGAARIRHPQPVGRRWLRRGRLVGAGAGCNASARPAPLRLGDRRIGHRATLITAGTQMTDNTQSTLSPITPTIRSLTPM